MDLSKDNENEDLTQRCKVRAIWTYLYSPNDDHCKQVSLLNMPYYNNHTCPEDIIAEHNVAVEFIINDKLPLEV